MELKIPVFSYKLFFNMLNIKVKVLSMLLFAVIIPVNVIAQNKDWHRFAAIFEGTPGIIEFDSALYKIAPLKTQPYMLSTAVKIYRCTEEGLPLKEELKMLLQFSEAVESLLSNNVKYTFAGTFAHNCVQLNYYFVSDTSGLRQKFALMYKNEFSTRTLGLNIEQDEEWDTYLNFLFPGKKYGLLERSITIQPK